MPHPDTILQQLKDHSVPPPAGITEAIYRNIQEEKTEAIAKKELEAVSNLKHHSTPAPPLLLDNILREAGKDAPARVVPFSKYIPRIAAALLLIAGIAVVIRLAGKKDDPAKETAALPVVENKPREGTAPAKKDSIVTTINSGDRLLASVHPEKRKLHNAASSKTGNVSVDGEDFAVQDNDLLFSFTNFEYNNLPSFLTEEETHAIKVNFDKSTSITLSEGMVEIMKRSYQQKRNGKPTARARRERKKIQRWKDADTKFFDKNVEKNPMDPMDLAEFLF